jgi:hypothetical protein
MCNNSPRKIAEEQEEGLAWHGQFSSIRDLIR